MLPRRYTTAVKYSWQVCAAVLERITESKSQRIGCIKKLDRIRKLKKFFYHESHLFFCRVALARERLFDFTRRILRNL